MKCIKCDNELKKRSQVKYCSNKCQIEYQYKEYISKWKQTTKDNGRWILTKNISKYIKKYFIEKYSESCTLCGWDKKHKITGRVPLEIDHIDGNSENNSEHNLRLICPNCHALTHNFKNMNKGSGRQWRRKSYK